MSFCNIERKRVSWRLGGVGRSGAASGGEIPIEMLQKKCLRVFGVLW